jgi:hypothetical protein
MGPLKTPTPPAGVRLLHTQGSENAQEEIGEQRRENEPTYVHTWSGFCRAERQSSMSYTHRYAP